MDYQNNVFSNFRGFLEGRTEVVWPTTLVLPWTASPSFLVPMKSGVWDDRTSFKFPTIDRKISEEEKYKAISSAKTFQITACPHTYKKHYAKNMCSTCYHKQGRGNYARSCPHKDKPLYARGKCQSCYLHQYHRSRVFGRRRRVPKSRPQCITRVPTELSE